MSLLCDYDNLIVVRAFTKLFACLLYTSYFAYKKTLIPDIKKAFKKLEEYADIIAVSYTHLDGTYNINLDFEGGSGKASIASPAEVTISGGAATATVQWLSLIHI